MTTHKCPHPECPQQIAPDQFACGMHWLRLPAGLRHLINRRYRDYVKRRSMYHLGALRRAQAEGIEFFTPKESQEGGAK